MKMNKSNKVAIHNDLPARFWNNLEVIYRETLLKIEKENKIENDIKILHDYPYNEMAKYGWVPKISDKYERVCNFRKFFEISSLDLLSKSFCQSIVCRKLGNSEKSDNALLVWAQKAKLESRNIETKPINISKLVKILTDIKQMTLHKHFDFGDLLQAKLADCGIAIVFLPHIGGSFLHGATFYNGNKIVIGMTIRSKEADRFWFSLFHEFGHIILGHINNADGVSSEDESKADEFARESLIPKADFDNFVSGNAITKANILRFSKALGISSGIIVGRLQKERFLPFNRFNDLKKQYELI